MRTGSTASQKDRPPNLASVTSSKGTMHIIIIARPSVRSSIYPGKRPMPTWADRRNTDPQDNNVLAYAYPDSRRRSCQSGQAGYFVPHFSFIT